jgi:transposase
MASDDLSVPVLMLARKGLPPREIARRFGITANSVSCRLHYWRKQGVALPAPKVGRPKGTARAHLTRTTRQLHEDLQPYAARRCLTVKELCRRILNAVAEDDLVDAILDDLENDE